MKQLSLFSLASLIAVLTLSMSAKTVQAATSWWDFQAIDTMKYSRDPSRQFLSKPAELSALADQQVRDIALTGATHVAVATPYDEEFLPVMKVWVAAARKYNLHVWFRGNWSGWERWFGYSGISRAEHIAKTKQFIETQTDLFESGDIFSACPECENGGPGDPRLNGDAAGHRQFLIAEYKVMQEAFKGIGKNVQVNYNSMNGDVARLIMDKPTTQALGGVVVVDHYVEDPAQLNADVTDFANRSGGKVVLGEFGAPIPDIHGHMTEDQQAAWLEKSFALLALNPNLLGMSYWTNVGGSTAIWQDNGQAKAAVAVIAKYYSPKVVSGFVFSPLNRSIEGARVQIGNKSALADKDGLFQLPYLNTTDLVLASAQGYLPGQARIPDLPTPIKLELQPESPSWWYQLALWWHQLWQK